MFDPQKIIAGFDIRPPRTAIWPRDEYYEISVSYYSIFTIQNQLKCFFPPEKLSFPVHFPTVPGPHPAPLLFPARVPISSKNVDLSVSFWTKISIFHSFYRLFLCVHPVLLASAHRISSVFCTKQQKIRLPFLFVHHAKAPHFSMCIGCKSPPLNKGEPWVHTNFIRTPTFRSGR